MKKSTAVLFLIFTLISSSVFASRSEDRLIDAVTEGSYKEIRTAFIRNYDFIDLSAGDERKSLLVLALEKNRELKIIKYIVKSGVSVKQLTKAKQNALMFACQYSSDPAVIEYLVKKAKITKSGRSKFILTKDVDGEDCYDYALKNENPEMVKAVLEKYTIKPKDSKKAAEPVVVSAESDDENNKDSESESDEEEKHIENFVMNFDVSTVDIVPVNIDEAIKEEDEGEMFTDLDELTEVEVVVEKKSAEENKDENQGKATILFPLEDDTDYVSSRRKTYLFDDTDLDEEDTVPFDDFTSAERNFIENANKKDKFGRTPLMIASQKGDIEKMKDLLYSGADVQAKDNDGWTALMFASRYQTNPDVVELLIKSGSVVSTKNKHGITALNYAAGFNTNPMVLTVLLKNRSISDKEIRGAFVYAICSSAPIAVLNVFLKKGMQINVSYDGKTPLMYACETNDKTEIISWLLENGASTKLRTSRGKTAFDFASENTKLPHDGVYWALNE